MILLPWVDNLLQDQIAHPSLDAVALISAQRHLFADNKAKHGWLIRLGGPVGHGDHFKQRALKNPPALLHGLLKQAGAWRQPS